MAVDSVRAQHGELAGELFATLPFEEGGHADVVQCPVMAVQAEQQRTDMCARTILVPAESSHDAVGRTFVLDLEDAPLLGLVDGVEWLGDDAVEPRAFEAVEPIRSGRSVASRWRQVHGCRGSREQCLESFTSLDLGHSHEVFVVDSEHVPGDERRRRFLSEHGHSRRRRVDAQEWLLEFEAGVAGDDGLAVEDAALRQVRPERLGQFRKVAIKGFAVAALREDLVSVTEHERTEAVPFGLEQPALTIGQVRYSLGQHGVDRGLDGQAHERTIARDVCSMCQGGSGWGGSGWGRSAPGGRVVSAEGPITSSRRW